MQRAILALTLSCAGPTLAQEISLTSPIDCDLGQTCYIQQYVDHDPTPAARDFTCAGLTYDTHKGTDFALPSTAMMQAGVPVLAAAPGVVTGIRDGMPDGDMSNIENRECGNGLMITHTEGWTTQYCHLRQGSVSVQQGQRVEAGTTLGLVGQSGLAEFPHVHFVVRKGTTVVDPFDPDGTITCNTPGDSSLWQTRPAYRPGGIIDIGFAGRIPDYAEIRAGTAHSPGLQTDAPALVIWGFTFGTRTGDVLQLTLTGPQGTVITQNVTFDRAQALAFRATGKKRRSAPWPQGSYTGTVTLIRNGTTVDSRSVGMQLR